MTYMVPFDGSPRSKAALAKASLHAIALDDVSPALRRELVTDRPVDVVAVSIIPDSARYAREAGWIDEGEDFAVRDVAEQLHRQVIDLAPSARFDYEAVGRRSRSGKISSRLRQWAADLDADVVFIGSENAGRIVQPVTSVGRGLASDQDFDLCIVRHPLPPDVRERLKSDFFTS